MEIKTEAKGDALKISLSGRLDTIAAMDLEKQLQSSLDGVKELTIDCDELAYIASSGLRSLLLAQKRMNKQGKMTMINVGETVSEVLEMTGFVEFLDIRKK